MRGDRSVPRGEAGRVALRVRELLEHHERVVGAVEGIDGGDGYVERGDGYDRYVDDHDVDRDADHDADHDVDRDVDDRGPGSAGPSRWQRLQAHIPVRLDPGRRAAWGVGVAVVLAAVVTGVWLMSSRPAAVPVSARVPQVPGSTLAGTGGASSSAGGSSPGGASSGAGPAIGPAVPVSSPAGLVVVDVAGKVVRPGLYRLPAGSRIDDALRAAGGARRGVDLSSLNLAAPLADGQQVVVGVPGAAVVQPPVTGTGGSAAAGGATSAAAGPVNLNTATLEQLDALPGVGPVLAQHILDWRSQHGRFTGVDQLNDVSGIGDVKFAELKGLVTV